MKCQDCCQTITTTYFSPRKYDESKHHIFCKECLEKIKVCSSAKSMKIFLFDKTDFNNSKHIYISNPKNKNKYFIFSDILSLVIQKYGGMEKFSKIKNQKIKLYKKNELMKQSEMLKRKKYLTEQLELNKLEYKNHGDCYSFVRCGTPGIETVITNEIDKLQTIRNRKIYLAKELNKINIPIDETLSSCYNYINDIGNTNFSEIINNIKSEYNSKYQIKSI
jgi:hypothetical protein